MLAQTFTDFELIISDNASTDETEAICREYAEKDPRIRYIRQSKNIGPVPNFLYVLNQAQGIYFMWAAHDDRWHPDFISLTKRALDANPSADLAFSGMEIKNLLAGDTRRFLTGFISKDRKSFRYFFRLYQACPNLIYGLFRTNFIRKIKLQNFDFFDIYLTLLIELTSSIVIVPLFLYTVGTNGNRTPYSIEGGTYISCKNFVRQIFQLLKTHFKLPTAYFLFAVSWYWITKETRRANAEIRNSLIFSTNLKKSEY